MPWRRIWLRMTHPDARAVVTRAPFVGLDP
jgi:hypothetical protein